jgi:SAM-dependent methyltransferase
MTGTSRRPFYTEYAWAFDLLIDRPVRKECAVIAAWLVDRGVVPGAPLLDAGCGTGRYAIELARRGYAVHGLDLSPELIDVATGATASSTDRVSFAVGDISSVPGARYGAILCRGVLNDVIDDDAREAIFAAFATALKPGGVLILDVRDWSASAERKAREPLFRKRVSTDRGELTFTSVTTLDPDTRRLLISERHELSRGDDTRISEHEFVMRCWQREELDTLFVRYGLGDVQYFGAYDPAIELGATDRIVAVTQKSGLTLAGQ